jgi:putative nucleotidyltransferase with HDIG domain
VKDKSVHELKEHIERVSEIYTLPSVLLEILALCQDPDSAPREISQCVERDQAIAMKVLRIANSAYTGLRQRVSSIPLAVHLLGPREVVEIATSVAVFQFVGGKYVDPRFDLKALWCHSVQTAAVAGLISDKLDRPSTGAEFTAGLLHDVGKVIMAQEFPNETSEMLDVVEVRLTPALEAEIEVFGVTHAEIGGWLSTIWGLPQRLVEAITFHHNPAEVLSVLPPTTDPALSALIYLANAIAQPVGAGETATPELAPQVFDTAQKLLMIEHPSASVERLAAVLEEVKSCVDRADNMISVVGEEER